MQNEDNTAVETVTKSSYCQIIQKWYFYNTSQCSLKWKLCKQSFMFVDALCTHLQFFFNTAVGLQCVCVVHFSVFLQGCLEHWKDSRNWQSLKNGDSWQCVKSERHTACLLKQPLNKLKYYHCPFPPIHALWSCYKLCPMQLNRFI